MFIHERNNSYYFSRANQQKAGTKIYSLTQCSLTVNECDWHILVGNDERISSHCLIRHLFSKGNTFVLRNIKENGTNLGSIVTIVVDIPYYRHL